MRVFLSTLALGSLLLVSSATVNAQTKKIGIRRAQQIATAHAKGLRLMGKELERENGKWIYSFEFKNRDGSVREVNVNAYTGKVVGIERENVKKEAQEERMEKKKN